MVSATLDLVIVPISRGTSTRMAGCRGRFRPGVIRLV
jgi:hypothetical protein